MKTNKVAQQNVERITVGDVMKVIHRHERKLRATHATKGLLYPPQMAEMRNCAELLQRVTSQRELQALDDPALVLIALLDFEQTIRTARDHLVERITLLSRRSPPTVDKQARGTPATSEHAGR